ncbi:MAG: glutamate formimidoyltransferase [Anaerolineae bacterium]
MRKLVECVPNFSEGRRKGVVDRIAEAIASVGGVRVLDVQMDADHNRSVITFVGPPAAVEEAAFRGVAKAAELIDMEQHRGEHPRMGAADVVPFVPLSGVTMEDCVAMAQRLGRRIGEELGIPVYLYEEAATREERRNLADVRRGEYEGIKVEIETNPDRAPDFGPHRLGKAGATAVGARWPLIAYNVNLGTDDLQVAKAIARAVRHSSGGLRYVKALGLDIRERGIVQVSMNMTRYQKTPLHRVFEMIKREAARYGVPVIGSEIVGLTPQEALLDAAAFYLQLEGFSPHQVLESRLREEPTTTPRAFLEAVAEGTPAPGGGSVSALAGALAGALTVMVCNLTLGREKYAAVEVANARRTTGRVVQGPKPPASVREEEMEGVRRQAQRLQAELTDLVEADSAAFQRVVAAYRLPRGSAEEAERREAAVQEALQGAAEVPLVVADKAVRVLELIKAVAARGNVTAVSDAGVAGFMAQAAVQGAALNVRANAMGLRDRALAEEFLTRITTLQGRGAALVKEIEGIIASRLG